MKTKITGIYKIYNIINKKYYVGSSSDVYKRWSQHKYLLNKNKHSNNHLQNSWNKYGANNFEFVVVQECCDSDLLKIEQTYLVECKNNPNTNYMISYNAYAPMRGRHHTENTKKVLREKSSGRIMAEESKIKYKNTMLKRHGVSHNFYLDSVKHAKTDTFMKNYGVSNPFANENIKEKIKHTLIKKLGCENPSQSEEVKNKKKETCLKNHGVSVPLQSSTILSKFRNTIQQKYGVDNVSKLESVKEKKKMKLMEFKKFLSNMTDHEFEEYLKNSNKHINWIKRYINWRKEGLPV